MKSYIELATAAALKTKNLKGEIKLVRGGPKHSFAFCCWKAVKTGGSSHLKSCSVWKPKDRRELKESLDIGQGEGCEGGKCEVRR